MAKLNQIIAVVLGKKAAVEKAKTSVYHDIQKPTLFAGIVKTYAPLNEEGEKFPSERKAVQLKVKDCISSFRSSLTELFDCVATQDAANTEAKADVKIGDTVILEKVPVTTLLFLEKQLTDLNTFVSKLPTLDPAYEWAYDDKTDGYATLPVQTTKTKKVPTAFELSKATDKHPAQVERVDVDILTGYWTTITYSGAIKASERNDMLERIKQLSEAVKMAREEANTREIEFKFIAKKVLDYVFAV